MSKIRSEFPQTPLNLTFYFLKNDVLTNCQLETIIETDMGVELTIQDTSEIQEEVDV